MTTRAPDLPETHRDSYDIVVLAASAGGIEAITEVLHDLPSDFPVPIIAVLHHSPDRSHLLIHILAKRTPLRVLQAVDGDTLRGGSVYLAHGNRHMLVTSHQTISSRDTQRINWLRSSSEPLLRSIIEQFGSRAIAVIMSGSGKNGAAGAKALHDAGGLVLAQDRASARHYGMPSAAIEVGAVNEVVPLNEIAPMLIALTSAHGAREGNGAKSGRA
jgi:two-component system, chemotaxis family, protein-glutamate methylesterase/glutaminase